MKLPLASTVSSEQIRRPVGSVHQIEIESNCNLRCVYCPSPHLQRPKIDMADDTFEGALDLVKFFAKKGTQGELNLAGIGESTLHPKFVEFVYKARAALPKQDIVFATNGLLFTDEMAQALKDARPRVWVSLHRPEKAMRAVQAAQKAGLLVAAMTTPITDPIDWAGQVEWPVDVPHMEKTACPWLLRGFGAKGSSVMVLADGRISHCCLDSSGVGVIGKVGDDPATLVTHPSSLCSNCRYAVV